MTHEVEVSEVMSDQPQTWHYGLVARWWAEFNVARPDELGYYRKCIERFGQPALDMACGTGRLLLPLLEAGLDIDGCDLSPDMLALCHFKAARQELAPRLYEQAMHALDLPRTYRTIYICDSFGLGGHRHHDHEALRRFHRHLEPGGALVFSHDVSYAHAGLWRRWLEDERRQLPEGWPASGDRREGSDGSEYELKSRMVDLDPLEQRLTLEIRATQQRDGKVLAQEDHVLRTILYFRNELLLMLEAAGFGRVTVYGGYSEAVASANSTMLVFVAEK